MIKSLRLQNFQAHKDSFFEFCSGVNVIIGTTDHGKSSAVRGIRWVLTSRPLTNSFIRKGTGTVGKRGATRLGTAEVDIVVERKGTEVEITRTKGHEINSCTVGDKEFNTLNKDVPEEVLEVLNMEDINMQLQHDRPYLMFESAGAVASVFNKFTNLDKVEGAVSILNSDLKACTVEKKGLEVSIAENLKDLEKYDYLPEFEKLVVVFEEIDIEINKITSGNSALELLIEELIDIEERLDLKRSKTIKLKKTHAAVKDKFTVLQKVDGEHSKLLSKKQDLDSVVNDIEDATESIQSAKSKIPSLKKRKEISVKLLALAKREDETASMLTELETLVNAIEDDNELLKDTVSKRTGLGEELADSKKLLADIDVCVTCGQDLDAKSKALMLENLQ